MARGAELRHARWAGIFGGALRRRRLWHLSRKGVARGAAIGVSCGLLFPIAQIPVAVATAVLAGANVPVAAAATLVTNPITFAPIYYGAYRIGSRLTGQPPGTLQPADLEPHEQSVEGWWRLMWERVARLGKPLVVGLAVLAVTGGTLVYLVADGLWVLGERARRRNSRRS